ncbi:MAG TPA: hypothetical protein PK275_07855 [Chitinophagaceae bacterium]|nr:hypothetical protein [Chitinophagaceae bacterium]
MARSHHRKKHKTHLQSFKHSHDTSVSQATKNKSSAKIVFALGGAVAGFVASYFAADGSTLWMTIATLAGAVSGYYIGKKVDGGKA